MGRIWRAIAGTRTRRIVVAIVVVGLAVAITAIIGSGSRTTVQASFTSDESCTSADVEANVRLTVYSSAGRSACEAVDRGFGREGSFWRVQPEGAELEGELVCSLAKGKTLVEVRDTGGHYYGNHFCAFFTGKGWREQEGPGSQIERERPSTKPKQKKRKNEAIAKKKLNVSARRP